MFDVSNYSENLVLKDGVFFPEDNNLENISYPDDGYDKNFKLEEESFWYNHRINCIKLLISKYIKDATFFDIGGSNGFNCKKLQDSGQESVLVEPALQACLNAQKRGVNNIICSTLDKAKIIDSSLKAVGLFDVLEHIEEDAAFLRDLKIKMSDGGTLFLAVPAYNFLWSRYDKDSGHFRRYSLKEISKMIDASGFEIVYSTYIFSFLILPIFLLRALPYSLGFDELKSENTEKHHKVKNTFFEKVFDFLLNIELNFIRKNKKILFGTSCLLVARKAVN